MGSFRKVQSITESRELRLVGLLVLLGVLILWLYPRPQHAELGEGVVEIRYMAPDGPIKDAMEDVVREFERLSLERNKATNGVYPIYKVVAGQNASRNQVEDPTRFLLSLLGGEPPDVIFFDRFAIAQWASRGAFRPLDDFVASDREVWDTFTAQRATNPQAPTPWPGALAEPPRAEGARPMPPIEAVLEEDFYPGCWNEGKYLDPVSGDIKQYGIPCNADTRVLLYNKDILKRYGFTDANGEARPPQTWEELEAMVDKIIERDEDGNLKRVAFIPDFGDTWLYMYGWQNGAQLMSDDGREVRLDSPEMVKALTFMARIYQKLGGKEEVDAFKSTFQGDALDPFVTGKVAMKTDGVWIMESLARFGRDLNVAAAPPPMPADRLAAGAEPATLMAGWAYAIPSTTREAEGAWELIRYLVSRRAFDILLHANQQNYEAQGRPYLPRQFPNRKVHEWAFQTFIEDSPLVEDKFKAVMTEYNRSLEYGRYRPVTPVGQYMWNAQRDAMERAFIANDPSPETMQEILSYQNGRTQKELDLILNPPPGKPIHSWNWFIAFYVCLIIAVMVFIYHWDTNPALRKRFSFGKIARYFGSGEKAAPAITEGAKGSYFRAQWKEGVLCASPWIIGFVVFIGGPMLFSIFISFCSYDALGTATFTGLDNYVEIFSGDDKFWVSLWNTVFMVMGVPLGIVLGLAMAILLTREVKGVALWRTCFYLPSIVPLVATSILWIWILNPHNGLINNLLGTIGIDGPNWLQSQDTSKWALILMGLWGCGGGMIIWIAGIKGISTSYYEAASIDGANGWQQFVTITIPQLSPYIFFNLIMGLIGTFQIFAQAFIMTSGGPGDSTLFYVYHLFNNAFRYLKLGPASAMAWFLFLIVLALTLWQMRLSKKWVHYEGD